MPPSRWRENKGRPVTSRNDSSGPPERKETVRRKILALLLDHPLTARQISALAGIPEKEVASHLPHIRKTAVAFGGIFEVTPAACRRCGYAFRKRERPTRPGRCPVCRGESISEPLFAVDLKRS